MSVRQFLAYLQYILRHKWFVFVACCRLGIPWLGIVHDLSKFSSKEFGPYARNFFNRDGSKRSVRDKTGAYNPNSQAEEFKLAWLNHQRNKHHWQAWVSIGDGGSLNVLPMPYKCCVEMVADWIGAGMAISGRKDPRPWYKANAEDMLLHPTTKETIESILAALEADDE
jgi:hypothetical protein